MREQALKNQKEQGCIHLPVYLTPYAVQKLHKGLKRELAAHKEKKGGWG